MTSSPAEPSVSPATNGRVRNSLAMTASCSESNHHKTEPSSTTPTCSASAIKSGIWILSNVVCARGLADHQAELDRGSYPTGIKVTDEQLATVNMTPDNFRTSGTVPSSLTKKVAAMRRYTNNALTDGGDYRRSR